MKKRWWLNRKTNKRAKNKKWNKAKEKQPEETRAKKGEEIKENQKEEVKSKQMDEIKIDEISDSEDDLNEPVHTEPNNMETPARLAKNPLISSSSKPTHIK
jgi:hypothetical protein